jgi:hypothetical protein
MNEPIERPSSDEMIDTLGAIQRRKLLLSLLDHNSRDGPAVVPADIGSETGAGGRSGAIYHTHLPKLAEYGFIEWDRERSEVERGPNFDEIRPLLELLDEHEDELPTDWV